MEKFKTTDIRLASFLRANRCDMVDLGGDYSSNKYDFIFEKTDILSKLLVEWHDPKNDMIKDVLYQHTLLKKAIRDKKLTH